MLKSYILGFLLAGIVATASAASDSYDAVRKTVKSMEGGLVTVRIVWKMSMSMEGDSSSREMKRETVGTVIDSTGLTLVSLSEADPTAMYGIMLGEDGPDIQASATDVKLITPDGTQIASKVVLRDRDLNFMFIRPVNKLSKPIAHMNLSTSSPSALLDQVFVVSRLGKTLNRAIAVQEAKVLSVLEKPRKRYVLDRGIVGGAGTPVLSLSGKPIGITTYKMSKMSAESRGDMDYSSLSQRALVIVPCEEVLKVARLAPQEERVTTPVSPSKEPGKTNKKSPKTK